MISVVTHIHKPVVALLFVLGAVRASQASKETFARNTGCRIVKETFDQLNSDGAFWTKTIPPTVMGPEAMANLRSLINHFEAPDSKVSVCLHCSSRALKAVSLLSIRLSKQTLACKD